MASLLSGARDGEMMSERNPAQTTSLGASLDQKAAWHRQQAQLPLVEKVRILLELQRQDYELLQRHRQLEWWERPWEIDP
jgi:hypothetical protein